MEKKLASRLYTSLHTDRYAMCVLTQLTMRAMNKLEGNGLELICNLIGRYHNGLHRLVDALLVPLARVLLLCVSVWRRIVLESVKLPHVINQQPQLLPNKKYAFCNVICQPFD